MQLPDVIPLEENIVCTNKDELLDLIYKAFSNREFSGLFLKIFTKDEKEKYYGTILLDRKKLLAVQIDLLSSKKKLIGNDSTEILKKIINYPLVVDLYGLDEISLKLSITDNLEIYNATPKIELEKIFEEGRIESAEVIEKERLLEKALEKKEIEIWDPNPIRDYLFIDDAVSALIIAGRSVNNGIFNIGTGKGTSAGELASLICDILSVSWYDVHRPQNVPFSLVGDYGMFNLHTGWMPKVSLKEGIKKTIDYWKEKCKR